MAYGLKYECNFDDLNGDAFTIEFLKKDYTPSDEEPIELTGASSPVVHSWSTDDPQPPIKGSSLEIRLVNKEGEMPIDSFFSVEDDTWQVKLYKGSDLKFIGFLVQDDFGEVMVDYAHEIKLTATDNLGLLKDVKLPDTVDETKFSILNYFRLCLFSTNLQLPLDSYSELQVQGCLTGRWMDDIFLDVRDFYDGNEYNSCYTVLEKILKRFHATLMQVNGRWVVVRFDPLRIYSGAIPGFSYLPDVVLGVNVYVYDSPITFNATPFDAGVGELTFAETGITKSVVRPFKFAKEKFNYKNPSELLRNSNFDQLGALLSTTTLGGLTIEEYEMKYWDAGLDYNSAGTALVPSTAERLIRVVKNANEIELGRVGVIRGPSGFNDRTCADSTPVEVVVGDIIEISFDVRSTVSQTGTRYFEVTIITTDPPTPRSVNNRNLNNDGSWSYNGAIGLNTSDWDQWQTISVKSYPVQTAGLMYVKLAQVVIGGGASTEYRNIKLDIIHDGLGKNIKGHTHTDTQDLVINNSEEIELSIDESPANSIEGTMFLHSFTGPIRNRAELWRRGTSGDYYRLGQLTTFDTLFHRRIQRLKLEGTLYGLVQSATDLSILTLINYTYFPNDIFIFGQCEIDYRNLKVRGTLYEWYKDTEEDSDLTEIYEYKYLYDK